MTSTPDEILKARELLKGSVLRYERPLEPAMDPIEWGVNR